MELLYATATATNVFAATSLAETERLIWMFEGIAGEEGWQPGDQLRAFVQSSVYFMLTVEGELAGGLQLVRPSTLGFLPGHAVWPELPPAGPDAAHIVVLALRKEFRGSPERFWMLCAEMWRHCFRQRIAELRLECTPAALRIYRRLGWPLEVVGEARTHWGEDCLPVRFDVCAAAGEVVRRGERSALYRGVAAQLFRPADSIKIGG